MWLWSIGSGNFQTAQVNSELQIHHSVATSRTPATPYNLRLDPSRLTPDVTPPCRYYITAAPQCVYPDSALGAVLNAASFDAIYVQFCQSNSEASFIYLDVLVDNDPWGWTQITTLVVSKISILHRYASRAVEYDESDGPLSCRTGTSVSGMCARMPIPPSIVISRS